MTLSPEVPPRGSLNRPDAASLSTASPLAAGIVRAMDANLNRLLEGLRVAEDYARFVLDRQYLVAQCKQLRHRASSTLEPLLGPSRYIVRDVAGDVGTQLTGEREFERPTAGSIVAANLQRAKEACRVLEEFCKLSRPDVAFTLEQLRYRLYSLEQQFHVNSTVRDRLATAQLYVLIDGGRSAQDFAERVRSLVESRLPDSADGESTSAPRPAVDILQLRDKQLDDRTLVERAEQLRELTAEQPTLIIVNDRPDIARVIGADGVHVGQTEMRAHQVRALCGPEQLIGISTHSVTQAVEAVRDGADYIGIGPIFTSRTKNFDAFVGPALVAAVQREVSHPGFAIGGITAANVGELTALGCGRIAVSQAVWGASDPGEAVRALRAALPSLTALRGAE